MAHFQLSAGSSVNRWIDLETPIGRELLLVEEVSGVEELGRSFEYQVTALSNRNDLDFDELLGQHMTLLLETDGPVVPRRPVDGRVAQIGLVGMRDSLYRYRILLRPWLWILSRTQDCRIFQNATTEEILGQIFSEHAESDHEFRLTGHYAQREYCVQYRETDFDFVSRLLEEEGMYYFFEHERGKHTLVICDTPGTHESVGSVRYVPHQTGARLASRGIREWSYTRQIQPGATALRDYNFETPSVDLQVRAIEDREHGESEHEVFDYPGEYATVADGEPLVRTRLEEFQAAHASFEGRGDSLLIRCGAQFSLVDFARVDQNRGYLAVQVQMRAANNIPEIELAASYECRFRLIADDVQYRSPRITRRPVVQGPQTAVVVGPQNEEIHVDQYGRIKVQFHWDRYGKRDDRSSCWVRVSQVWAGKNYGWMTVPRVGQEVVVDFLEGNPDCPLVTGRVYNAEQMPPWALPANKTQSGILTRSSGGSPSNANELRFEDKKGEELVKIHAERNMSASVEVDDSTTVGHDQSLTVDNDQRTTVKHDQFLDVGHDRTVHVVHNEIHKVDVDQTLTVRGVQHNTVLGTQTTEVRTGQTVVVGQLAADGFEATEGATRIDFTKGIEHRGVTRDQNVKVGGNQFIDVTGELVYKAKRMHFEAEHIEHKVTGKNSVRHESPEGPYTIIANEFTVSSNTDITIAAVGNITQICNKHTVQKMGPSEESFFSPVHSTKCAITNDFFFGLKSATSISASMTTDLGASFSSFLGVKLETGAGYSASLSAIKTYGPPSAKPTNFKELNAQKLFFALQTVTKFLGSVPGAGSALHAISGESAKDAAQAAEAKKKLIDLADEAAKAGHPNVAARMLAVAQGKTPNALLAGSTTGGFSQEYLDALDREIAAAQGVPIRSDDDPGAAGLATDGVVIPDQPSSLEVDQAHQDAAYERARNDPDLSEEERAASIAELNKSQQKLDERWDDVGDESNAAPDDGGNEPPEGESK